MGQDGLQSHCETPMRSGTERMLGANETLKAECGALRSGLDCSLPACRRAGFSHSLYRLRREGVCVQLRAAQKPDRYKFDCLLRDFLVSLAHLSFDDLQESCAVKWRRKQHDVDVGQNGPVHRCAGRGQLRPLLLPDAEGLLQGFLLPAGPGAAAQPPRGPGSLGRSSQRPPPPPHRQGELRGHRQCPAEDSGLWLQVPGPSPCALIPRRPLSEVAPSGGLLKASGWSADSRVQAQ
ncbi:uncharacterized protein LOC123951570 [Meles meles]|uniref:uncharacterized protein LOC123951570 n=1 Tax=Meles meles TaxID=9662 RepID=UPI001E69FE5E|nr:uncharacterized protein LOC123951570 [Meles meles]